MDVQDRENLTPDTKLQPRVGEMAPIGMHVIPHREVFWSQEETTSGQRSVYGVWLWSQVHFSIKELQIAHFLEKTMTHFKKGKRN